MDQKPENYNYSGYQACPESIYLTKNVSYQQVPSRSFPMKNVL